MIREFRIEDYDKVIALWNDCGLPYRPNGRDSRHRVEEELKQGSSLFLVAEVNGKLVGSVLGTQDGRKGWINRLSVHPSFRHRGIARKLVAEVERRFSQLGLAVVACLVMQDNTSSKRFFESIGYECYSDIAYFSKRTSPDA